jgi:NodT family efflux transporter outer membrane factor (OMF) lipoprotein
MPHPHRSESDCSALQRIVALLAMSAALLAGCAVGPNYRRPPAETPAGYKNPVPKPASAAAAPDNWWTLFQDAELDQLIGQVEVSNQNLAQAIAAYDQAQAAVRAAVAAFFPTVTASGTATRIGGGSRTNTIATFGSVGVGTPGTGGGASTIYQVSGSASWELDVWGRLRRSLQNAKATAQASAADLASARLSAQSQLATAYLQLREADAERRLLTATIQAYQRTLDITRNRYRVGTAPKTDVLQAETQLYTAQQQEAALRLQRAQLENAIAALVGKPASDFHLAEREVWSIPVPDVPPGVPSTLLERRPDVVAAERNVAAANATIGVQEAAYFPSITLTGTEGFLSTTLARLFEKTNESRQGALGLSETLLDFGATRARVAQARAAYAQTVAAYRQTVLTAFEDVENNLAAADWNLKEYEFAKQASDAADETERLTLNEYKAGTVDYTTVVVAQTAALSARRTLAQLALARQTTAVGLITSLGGGWKPAPAAP